MRRWLTHKNQKGITLLEFMLVMAIGTSMILLSLKMYESYKLEQSFDTLQGNVDILFQALGKYYKANCAGTTFNTVGASPVPVSIATLQSGGYLDMTGWIPSNSLVNNTGLNGPLSAFVLQFNPLPAVSVNTIACTSGSATPCSNYVVQALPAGQSAGVVWVAQVAVQLANTANITTYMGRMGAQCVSTFSATTVTPCTSTPTALDTLVWERLPSFVSPQATSILWPMMPMLKQFQLQYTHDQNYELNSGFSGTQYYTCGG